MVEMKVLFFFEFKEKGFLIFEIDQFYISFDICCIRFLNICLKVDMVLKRIVNFII